jgi:hypothetical protein
MGKKRKKRIENLDGRRNPLDYFIGGVPALGYFEMQADKLAELVRSSAEAKLTRLNLVAEVSLIGLASYFEAFCKAHFASLINICPEILRNFLERRKNATVSLSHILAVQAELGFKLGNVISEEYDFGSAKEVNGLYQDLLRVTPFSTKDAKKYSQFLSDRNLLVHHGGVFTYTYSSQRFGNDVAQDRVHMDSLIIGQTEFHHWKSFVVGMATKIATTTQTAIEGFLVKQSLTPTPEQARALRSLGSSR